MIILDITITINLEKLQNLGFRKTANEANTTDIRIGVTITHSTFNSKFFKNRNKCRYYVSTSGGGINISSEFSVESDRVFVVHGSSANTLLIALLPTGYQLWGNVVSITGLSLSEYELNSI